MGADVPGTTYHKNTHNHSDLVQPYVNTTTITADTADSSGRRNTLIVEVFSGGDEVLVYEDERDAGRSPTAVACGSGVAPADALARSA